MLFSCGLIVRGSAFADIDGYCSLRRTFQKKYAYSALCSNICIFLLKRISSTSYSDGIILNTDDQKAVFLYIFHKIGHCYLQNPYSFPGNRRTGYSEYTYMTRTWKICIFSKESALQNAFQSIKNRRNHDLQTETARDMR